jgi:protein-S-isoprenylcysteine O-methyltransferase Ste14
MYLGIVLYYVGATLVLQSPLLLALTAVVVAPYTAIRIAYEERPLRAVFGHRYAIYQRDVPPLLPFLR